MDQTLAFYNGLEKSATIRHLNMFLEGSSPDITIYISSFTNRYRIDMSVLYFKAIARPKMMDCFSKVYNKVPS